MTLWKTMVTIARPGFIVRNFNGDVFLNFSAGLKMWSIQPYRDAYKVLKAGGVLSKNTIESYRTTLQAANEVDAVGKFTAPVKLRGGTQTVNDRAFFNLAQQHGILPTYNMSSDILEYGLVHGQNQSWAQRAAARVQKTKYFQKMGLANEVASNYPRMAQFMWHMKDPKFTAKYATLEDAAQAAATSVRKFHPDVTALSPSAQRYGKRIIPFYSWSRLTTPIFAETLLTRPGIMTALPKLEYGYQETTGRHPNNMFDLYDPTRLLPGFARETMGTLGGNRNFDLGTSTEALASLLNYDPHGGSIPRNLADMITPAIKTPLELMTGKTLQNNSSITDKAGYFDTLIPGAQEVSSITGYSPIGTINNIINGAPFNGPVLDQTRSVQEGNRQQFDSYAIANFLLGLHMGNISGPGQMTVAQRQFRSGL
jgi:hypothetical protein